MTYAHIRYMIVKNYDITRGIVNGTLCELLQYDRSLLQIKLLSGSQEGKVVMLPRCTFEISAENSGLPFAFKRTQFPIIPGYCATVHKAQGQSLNIVGLAFQQDCFTHGQLYTALSRTGGWHKLYVMLLSGESTLRNKVNRCILC
jgi:ATP-dependent DNA helicase PIF1